MLPMICSDRATVGMDQDAIVRFAVMPPRNLSTELYFEPGVFQDGPTVTDFELPVCDFSWALGNPNRPRYNG